MSFVSAILTAWLRKFAPLGQTQFCLSMILAALIKIMRHLPSVAFRLFAAFQPDNGMRRALFLLVNLFRQDSDGLFLCNFPACAAARCDGYHRGLALTVNALPLFLAADI
jgi:hypothetical protein